MSSIEKRTSEQISSRKGGHSDEHVRSYAKKSSSSSHHHQHLSSGSRTLSSQRPRNSESQSAARKSSPKSSARISTDVDLNKRKIQQEDNKDGKRYQVSSTSSSRIRKSQQTESKEHKIGTDLSKDRHVRGREDKNLGRVEGNRENAKRRAAKSPTPPSHSKDERKRKRVDAKNPDKEVKKEEEVKSPLDGFGYSDFGNAGFEQQQGGFGFGNSGFANSGFTNSRFSKPERNSGFSNFGENWNNPQRRDNNQGKPRIMAPQWEDGDGGSNVKKSEFSKIVIVNELSAEAIKREENPLKGTNLTRRPHMRGGFVGQRGAGRGGNTFGARRAPTNAIGTHDRFATSRHAFEGFHSTANRGGVFPGQRVLERSDVDSTVVENPPLNPLAVPRGRNYFQHDHRNAITNEDRMYDPRLDRATNHGRSGVGRAFHETRGGGRAGPPMGWRNVDDSGKNPDEFGAFFRGAFQQRRGTGFTRGGGFAGTGPMDGLRPSWRSKADEDRVWKHDKYMEISQEEVGTKLELLDEVNAESALESYGQPAEGRQRYQEEDEDRLEYETEEMVVYD